MSAFHLTSILASLSSEACLQNQSRLHETLRAYAQTWTRNLGGRPTPIARSAGSRFFRHQAFQNPVSGAPDACPDLRNLIFQNLQSVIAQRPNICWNANEVAKLCYLERLRNGAERFNRDVGLEAGTLAPLLATSAGWREIQVNDFDVPTRAGSHTLSRASAPLPTSPFWDSRPMRAATSTTSTPHLVLAH
jgi:hypothetical protein